MTPDKPIPPGRNLWPLGIVMAFALFIAGTLALIIIATRQKTDLVSRDYYERELRYQAQMDRLDRSRRLGTNAAVVYHATQNVIALSLPANHARSATRGQIHLYRPSAAGLDLVLPLSLDAQGGQELDVSRLQPGLWRVKVSWTVEREEFFLERDVIVASRPS